tara:strand:- start:376 stop:621 length:246 start_codon:yes stop_codon:yes gene_type:complete
MITRIKICTGPGCRAWGSERMAQRLTKMPGTSEVCLVSCMDKCGGGASIRLKDRGKIFKLREMAEVTKLIKGDASFLTEAC